MSNEPITVIAAKGSPGCTVAVDLRRRSRVDAVAVDKKGQLRAWVSIDGVDDRVALTKLALDALKVTPKALRVLVGSELAQVAVFEGPVEPNANQVCETLVAEGYKRILQPAVSAVNTGADSWLVAGCDEEEVESLVAGLSELRALEPSVVVDQLMILQHLPPATVAIESSDSGLLIVARPRDAAPLTRMLPGVLDDVQQAKSEVLRTLDATDEASQVWTNGSRQAELIALLDGTGLNLMQVSMPTCNGQVLPPGLELVWRLATAIEPATLGSPQLGDRRSAMLWARRVAMMGIVLAVLSAVVIVYVAAEAMRVRARQKADADALAAVQTELQQLRETSDLARDVTRLRSELDPWGLPWPELATAIDELAREMPPAVGWERLAAVDGELELEVSAAGGSPLSDLMVVRRSLERGSAIINVSWDKASPSTGGPGLRQIFRATLMSSDREAP